MLSSKSQKEYRQQLDALRASRIATQRASVVAAVKRGDIRPPRPQDAEQCIGEPKPQPKQFRELAPKYLAFVRRFPCAGCGKVGPSDAHHLDSVGAGGSDYTAVPLCRICHTVYHQFGYDKFCKRYGRDLRRRSNELRALFDDQ